MRILSGIQPSGVLHIGNYFGMMRPAIALQDEGEALYFIADYHALTSLRDPESLRENSRRVALDFLACGLDPEARHAFSANRRAASDRAGLDSIDRDADGLAGARPFLQGQARARIARHRRLVHLPGADGGGHFDLRQRCCAGRQRSKTTHRNHPRHRREN